MTKYTDEIFNKNKTIFTFLFSNFDLVTCCLL